jgi:hypothetical protein
MRPSAALRDKRTASRPAELPVTRFCACRSPGALSNLRCVHETHAPMYVPARVCGPAGWGWGCGCGVWGLVFCLPMYASSQYSTVYTSLCGCMSLAHHLTKLPRPLLDVHRASPRAFFGVTPPLPNITPTRIRIRTRPGYQYRNRALTFNATCSRTPRRITIRT